jgi:hypothetical protein
MEMHMNKSAIKFRYNLSTTNWDARQVARKEDGWEEALRDLLRTWGDVVVKELLD